MYCRKCGAQIPEDSKFCPKCGGDFKPKPVSSSSFQNREINKEFILKNINTILAVFTILLMTLPMVVLKPWYATNSVAISGIDLATGVAFTDESSAYPNFFACLMILIPILSIVVNYVKQLAKIKKIVLLVAPTAVIVCLFLAKNLFASVMNEEINKMVTTSLGFWLYLIASLIWLVVNFLQYENLPLSKEGVSKAINKLK